MLYLGEYNINVLPLKFYNKINEYNLFSVGGTSFFSAVLHDIYFMNDKRVSISRHLYIE